MTSAMFGTALRTFALASALAAASLGGVGVAHAQTVVGSVNDDPITNVDIDQHMKILRVLRLPASREAALEDIYETRLKLIETTKFKIRPNDSDLGWSIGATAHDMKMEPQQLLTNLQRAGVSEDQWKQKWRAEAAWMLYIRALNRTLEVSEDEVRQSLNKDGKNRSAEYTVRQVILVIPNSSGTAGLGSRLQDAQALRTRFNDCNTGPELVRAFRDAVIKEPLIRSASAIGDQLMEVLSKTEIGHLTPPQRGPQGIEMLAVCAKSNRQDTSAAETLRNELLMKKLSGESKRRYQEVRNRAVIVNH